MIQKCNWKVYKQNDLTIKEKLSKLNLYYMKSVKHKNSSL